MKNKELQNKIAIVGVGYTQQGKVPGRTALSFHIEAVKNALKSAGLKKEDIDALYLYRNFDPIAGDTMTSAFTVAEQLGIKPKVMSQETWCTRTWVYAAISQLFSGLVNVLVLSYGDNAKTGHRSFTHELENNQATDELASFGDLSFLSKYAMLAQRARFEYETGPSVWANIAVAQRQWANLNPIASFKDKPLTIEDYLKTDYVVEPFRLLDATPLTDGGRAIILTTTEYAKSLGVPYVTIRGFGSANDPEMPYRLNPIDENSASVRSSRDAYAMAGLEPKHMDAAQIYDCFTYTVEATLRDYGFFKKEEAKDFLRVDHIGPQGSFPVNTSGGLLSEAYFMGLTPVSEAFLQLTDQAGQRQLGKIGKTKQPEFIICSDNGMAYQSQATLILERAKK